MATWVIDEKKIKDHARPFWAHSTVHPHTFSRDFIFVRSQPPCFINYILTDYAGNRLASFKSLNELKTMPPPYVQLYAII